MEHRSQQSFCFCTYAAGATYRALANELLKDLDRFAPGVPVILFTDRAQDFQTAKNALVFEHRQQGILPYHERRFAIAKALSMFDSCMYFDADVRICAPVKLTTEWQPGITARSCTRLINHIQSRLSATGTSRLKAIKTVELYRTVAQKLGLNLEADELTFVNEFLFVVTKDSGKEIEWLKLWEKIATYAELRGHHKHPAYAMALAAAKVNFPIQPDSMPGLDFFDDRIEKVRISKGESDPTAKQEYFALQKKLENPEYSLPQKVWNKVSRLVSYAYHSLRLRFSVLLNPSRFDA